MEPARINAAEVKLRLDRGKPVFLIDTRAPYAWNNSIYKIPGARYIHYTKLDQRLSEVPRDHLIVTCCT